MRPVQTQSDCNPAHICTHKQLCMNPLGLHKAAVTIVQPVFSNLGQTSASKMNFDYLSATHML